MKFMHEKMQRKCREIKGRKIRKYFCGKAQQKKISVGKKEKYFKSGKKAKLPAVI